MSFHEGPRHGFVATAVLRLILLFVVLAEVAFLASRHRVRADLTADQHYTLTPSTKRVLQKLDDLLVIEAYFSSKDNLSIGDQPQRAALESLLEEYSELGAGKVQVQYIDPHRDRTVREKAERLGMVPQNTRVSGGAGSVTATEIWQGLRVRYGAKKAEVVPYLEFGGTAYYERVLTPLIKRLTVLERPKIGMLAFRSRPGGRGMVIDPNPNKTPPQGFDELLRHPGIVREYDMVPLDISKGQLIPEDIGIAMLIRPKFLSDRTKFVFDQFLMRGGKLVVFADTCEIEVRYDRAFRNELVPYDADGAKLSFVEMLKTWGVQVENKIVAEGIRELQQIFVDDRSGGQGQWSHVPYPFVFEAADSDWRDIARKMALRQSGGQNGGATQDPLAKAFEDNVRPGMNKGHDLIKAILGLGAPGMFWPCPVDLAPKLPEGVSGEVLLRTSPLSWTEPPNATVDPFDEIPQPPEQRYSALRRWEESKALMLPTAPRQTSLMVHLQGAFPSYFADKEVPAAPLAPVAKPEKPPDDEDWGDETKEPVKKDGPLPEKPEPVQEPAAPAEPKLTRAPASAQLLVIGDADFLRDDFLMARYYQPSNEHGIPLAGPVDRQIQLNRPLRFFKNLCDWLAQERDLLDLQNKTPTDRSITFLERDEVAQETTEEFRDRLIVRHTLIQYVNWLGPATLLLLFGLAVFVRRHLQKRAFLSKL